MLKHNLEMVGIFCEFYCYCFCLSIDGCQIGILHHAMKQGCEVVIHFLILPVYQGLEISDIRLAYSFFTIYTFTYIRAFVTLFAFGPNLKIIPAWCQVVEIHPSIGKDTLHRLCLGIDELTILVEDMKSHGLHLMGKGIGKLHVHIVNKLQTQVGFASLLVVMPIVTRGKSQNQHQQYGMKQKFAILIDTRKYLHHYYCLKSKNGE